MNVEMWVSLSLYYSRRELMKCFWKHMQSRDGSLDKRRRLSETLVMFNSAPLESRFVLILTQFFRML